MVVIRHIKRWFRLLVFFVRLAFAFLNPFHEFWLDSIVFHLWELAYLGEQLKEDAIEMSKYTNQLKELINKMVRVKHYALIRRDLTSKRR